MKDKPAAFIDNHSFWTSPREKMTPVDAAILTFVLTVALIAVAISPKNEVSSNRVAPTVTPSPVSTLTR